MTGEVDAMECVLEKNKSKVLKEADKRKEAES